MFNQNLSKDLQNKVIPLWQDVGQSTTQITKNIAKLSGQKATHTGILDPMAEGVIIVLTGQQRFNKIDFAGWRKTYEFEIVLGIKTDSFDGLGYITELNLQKLKNLPRVESIKSIIQKFVGDYEQEIPVYSGKTVSGKKLFMYPKLGIPIDKLPRKKGVIYKIELLKLRNILLKEIAADVIARIRNIKIGEFRQDKVISDWEALYTNMNEENTKEYNNLNMPALTIKVEISRGMYIRALSQDICEQLKIPGFVYKLVRTQNGEFSKENCFQI